MATTINADNGVSSGSAGLKESADSSGVLELQTNGTTAVSISTGQVVTLTNALPVASGGTGATTNAGAAFALKGANSDITSLSGLTTPLSVSQGGTGLTTATGVLVGAGPTVSAVAAGTSGNVLTSDGTTWISAVGAGGALQTFTVAVSPGTWTKPATVKGIKVTVVGGGGSGGTAPTTQASSATAGGGGGGGGAAIRLYPAPSLPGPQPYTVGTAGGTSSFGVAPIPVVSATGGSAGGSGSPSGAVTNTLSVAGGGAGGSGSGGNLNFGGSAGIAGSGSVSPSLPFMNGNGGSGGSSFLGGGGAGGNNGGGSTGANYGGGGGGGGKKGPTAPASPGGGGAQGVIIIEEFY